MTMTHDSVSETLNDPAQDLKLCQNRMQTYEKAKVELDQLLKEIGILFEISSPFVDAADKQIKYTFTLSNGKKMMSGPFMTGLGWVYDRTLKKSGQGTVHKDHRGEVTIRDGKGYDLNQHKFTPGYIIRVTVLTDVIGCLCMDASCSADSFEDFCGNCGYDEDSRKALSTYEACRKTAKELRMILGDHFEKVCELANEL